MQPPPITILYRLLTLCHVPGTTPSLPYSFCQNRTLNIPHPSLQFFSGESEGSGKLCVNNEKFGFGLFILLGSHHDNNNIKKIFFDIQSTLPILPHLNVTTT